MNVLSISFQYSIYTANETPFRSEIMRYNDLEQTNTLFLRENRNQNASNFANAICIHVAWTIRTHGCYRISILISVILLFWTVYCEFYPMFSTVLIRLTMYGFRRCSCLIWKRKQHTFETFGQIKWITDDNESFQSSVRSACPGLNFSDRTESKQCKNKLSSKQRNPSS